MIKEKLSSIKHKKTFLVLYVIWLAIKLAVVLFAVFHGTNVSVLYQSF